MDLQHLAFCHPGTPFYDTAGPDGAGPDGSGPGDLLADLAPDGWQRHVDTEWTHLNPADMTEMPPQGWKIHVSAAVDNAERILGVVVDYCLPRGIAFKHLRSMAVLGRRNSKYGDRSASGKFVTIYPADDAQFETILRELGDLLDGEHGPYILSDLRWRSGPLYVRYGGFVARMMRTDAGQLVHCIEDPDGNLVPDRRGPGFKPPEWAPVPECLQEALAARNAGTLKNFPYRVTAAMHFSNGGGVYRATDTRTGAPVLLKEARPYAGVDEQGRDAVERQHTERWALETLAGLPAVPALLEQRLGHEHWFLVREFADGEPLQKVVSRRNPWLNGIDDPAALADYTDWALAVVGRVDESVARMHERGVVYGDLHPGNILVDEAGEVSFIDMETATSVDAEARQAIGAPGFRAPEHYGGPAVDRFAMGCIRLAMFVPLTVLLLTDPRKRDELLELVCGTFPVPDGFADAVRRDLRPDPSAADGDTGEQPSTTGADVDDPIWPEPAAADWPRLRDQLTGTIVACAEPERTDRLYPGDVGQFLLPAGGVSLAFGAAGVLAVLTDLGVEVPRAHVDWLLDRVRKLEQPVPGLLDGLAGVAYVLDRIGEPDRADEVLAVLRALPLSQLDDTLTSGLPGLALAYAHLAHARGDDDLTAACQEAVAQLRQLPLPTSGAAGGSGSRVGLLRGAAGRALAYLHTYHLTGEADLLTAAADALRHDLAAAGWDPQAPAPADLAVRRETGWLMPVLQGGGAGIALVADQLLPHLPAAGDHGADLVAFQQAVTEPLGQAYFGANGLAQGRAGAMLVLHQRGITADEPVMRGHLRRLGWLALPLGEGGLGFLGDGQLRMSFDLSSGGAGVVAVLDRVFGGTDAPAPLYLFGPGDLTR